MSFTKKLDLFTSTFKSPKSKEHTTNKTDHEESLDTNELLEVFTVSVPGAKHFTLLFKTNLGF